MFHDNMSQYDMSQAEPLSEPVLLILTSLAQEPKHGYAILKDVEAISHGRIRLSTGTLYGAIRRLLAAAWIDRFEDRAERDRQAYRLTSAGRAALEAEVERIRLIAAVAQARLAPPAEAPAS